MPGASKSTITYMLVGAAIIFIAAFIGVRAGFALKSNKGMDFTPEGFSNQTSLKIGDLAPALPVVSLNGESGLMPDMIRRRKTLLAIVLPGCGPCRNLLDDWSERSFAENAVWLPAVMAVGTPEQAAAELPDDFRARFPVYFCDEQVLDSLCRVAVFPTLLGIGQDGRIRFIISGYVGRIDRRFFDKYL